MKPSGTDQVRPVGEDQLLGRLLDEFPEDSEPQPYRLAGVGAALGSCFSVMFILLAIGAAGSIASPQSGLAEEIMSTQGPVVSSPRQDQPRFADADVQRLQTLDRTAITARAQAQAAESKLALIRSRIQQNALQHATQARVKVNQLELHGSPHQWVTTEQLATRTRRLARAQLETDLASLESLQESAETELERLREAADRAERMLAAAQEKLTSDLPGSSSDAGPVWDVAPPQHAAPTAAPASENLLALIARHHASLTEVIPSTGPRD